MHGLIYQISDQPIQKNDYIMSSDFDEGDNPFDYCRDMNEKEINGAIAELANILPKEMFTCKGREITFNGEIKISLKDGKTNYEVKLIVLHQEFYLKEVEAPRYTNTKSIKN